MKPNRTTIPVIAAAALLAIGLPLAAQGGKDMPAAFDQRDFDFGFQPSAPGVVVREVGTDSAADNAGLEPGDWITAVGGQTLDGHGEQFAEIINALRPGDQVSLDYKRDRKEITVAVTLAAHPETGAVLLGISYQDLPTFDEIRRLFDEVPDRSERRRLHRQGDLGRALRNTSGDADAYGTL